MSYMMRLNDKYKDMLDGIEAVIFDLDGSLCDSMWIWGQIDIDFLGGRGISVPKDLQKAIEGISALETAVYFKNRFGFEDSPEEILSIWVDMAYEKYRTSVKLKAGAKEFIYYLKDNGYKLAICSSNAHDLVETALRANDVLECFDAIISDKHVTYGKPNPECYLKAAEALGILPERCIAFEDIVKGIEAAHNAGMKACGVEDAYSEYQREEKIKMAEYYINDFTDLYS